MQSESDILFILKRREDYNSSLHYTKSLSTGLSNSCAFLDEMLKENKIISNIEIAIDNNCIDGLVTRYKPKIVVIEALWVVPEKFQILTKLHPDVKWIVRLHSEIPFLANEGIALQWVFDYLKYAKVFVAANSNVIYEELKHYVCSCKKEYRNKILFLPNYYSLKNNKKKTYKDSEFINISCFGAIRPLKNHLIQAVAALKFADNIGKKLNFHVNAGRLEMNGDPIFKNLQSFFSNLKEKGHRLVINEWKNYEEFLTLCGEMDIGMQCSFSETFNIVAADHIKMGVPVVVSGEIPWACSLFIANPVDSNDICAKLDRALTHQKVNIYFNKRNITKYNTETENHWLELFLK
jgi:hypothetical protein